MPAGSNPIEPDLKVSYDFWLDRINGLFNLPANRTQIKFQKKDQNQFFLTRDLSDIVEAYYYDQSVKFEAKDTVLLNDSNLEWKNNEWILGDSKIALLQKPLSTLLAAYEARYVILNKRGAIGIFTATSDSSGALPLLKKEKKNFQNQLSNYGLNRNQSQFMFTNKPLNYQSLAVHIKDMQVLEGHELDRRIVFDGFNFPKDLAAQDSGAKYENQKDAEKRAYTDGVFPYMKPIYTALNTLLQTKENGIKIVPNLDDIESLKADYKKEIEMNNTKMNAVLNINNNIKMGAITPEIAFNILTNIWDFDKELAEQVINENPPEIPNLENSNN